MKRYSSEELTPNIFVVGNPIYPCYLIKGKEKNILIDAGVNLFAHIYLKDIKKHLGDENKLNYLFLTHSHYDHIGGVSYLKQNIKNLKVGGFETINQLLKKEKILKHMNKLSDVQRTIFKDLIGDEKINIEPFTLDIKLKDGDKFDLGELTCEVLETPGHTRDSLSFFFPEIKAIFAGEVIGVPDWKTGNMVQVEFLSSYEDTLNSIKKIQPLKPKYIGMAHGWFFSEEDATEYLAKSYSETIAYKKLIEEYLKKNNMDINETINNIVKIEYDEKKNIAQERNAYMANLTAQVKHVASLIT